MKNSLKLEFYLASCAAALGYRDLVVFQLQIVKNFQSAHRTETIYIHKNCYLINNDRYKKRRKNLKKKSQDLKIVKSIK